MIWIDYAILGIVGISGVISLRRGFVREALSLVGWIAAFWVAIAYSGRVTPWLEGYVAMPSWLEGYVTVPSWLEGFVAVPSVRVIIGFVVLFVVVLLACVLVQRTAGALVVKTGMSGTDRTLGIVFGVLRGAVVVGLLVLLAGLTPLPRDPWWSESSFLPHFVDVAREIGANLPDEVRQHLDFDPEQQVDCDPEQQPDCGPELQLDGQPES